MTDEPLGLTVHSLPAPRQAAASDAQRTARGRRNMLAVLLVCAAPVVASYITYYVVRPEGRRNFGELIDPQRPIPGIEASTLGGQAKPLSSLKGQWLLVSVADAGCDQACEKHLYLQRQLREGLGKNKDRLDWVWLVSDTQPVRAAMGPALSQATVLRVDPAQLGAWLAPVAGRQLQDHLYVVDPMGNWMMRFPALDMNAGVAAPNLGIDPTVAAKFKRDLEHLMRGSTSWDQAGRP